MERNRVIYINAKLILYEKKITKLLPTTNFHENDKNNYNQNII